MLLIPLSKTRMDIWCYSIFGPKINRNHGLEALQYSKDEVGRVPHRNPCHYASKPQKPRSHLPRDILPDEYKATCATGSKISSLEIHVMAILANTVMCRPSQYGNLESAGRSVMKEVLQSSDN